MSVLLDNGTYPIFEWTPCTAAIVAVLGRFCIRWRYIKAARLDDLFCGLALVSLIGFIATLHVSAYNEDAAISMYTYLASNFLLWSTLYFVKASFLVLMWSIFNVSGTFRKWWWAVSVYTLIGFIVSNICQLWTCGTPSDFGNVDICYDAILSTTSVVPVAPDYTKIAFHLSSDLFILALPLFYIRKLQMSRSKKIGVAAVFALTIIDIITGILRNASSICEDSPETWNNSTCIDMNIITAIIEPSFAVVVCALPAYRAILPSSRKRRYESMELRRNAARLGDGTPKRSQFTESSEGSHYPMAETRTSHENWPVVEDSPAHSMTVSATVPMETKV